MVKGRFGMGGRLAVLLSAWRYAIDTERELVVDWNDSAYWSPSVPDVYTALLTFPHAKLLNVANLEDASNISLGLARSPQQVPERRCCYALQTVASLLLTTSGLQRMRTSSSLPAMGHSIRLSPGIPNCDRPKRSRGVGGVCRSSRYPKPRWGSDSARQRRAARAAARDRLVPQATHPHGPCVPRY